MRIPHQCEKCSSIRRVLFILFYFCLAEYWQNLKTYLKEVKIAPHGKYNLKKSTLKRQWSQPLVDKAIILKKLLQVGHTQIGGVLGVLWRKFNYKWEKWSVALVPCHIGKKEPVGSKLWPLCSLACFPLEEINLIRSVECSFLCLTKLRIIQGQHLHLAVCSDGKMHRRISLNDLYATFKFAGISFISSTEVKVSFGGFIP